MAKKQIATFLGPQLGLSVIGDHAYGYNQISIADTETSVLSFHTGKEYIVGGIQLNIVADTPDDYAYKVKINGQLVTGYLTLGAQQGTDANNILQVVLPPLCKVEVTAQNVTDTSSNIIVVSLVGRVYA